MSRKQVWPHGESYRGPMSIYKGKKLTLPRDLFQFLVRAMKRFRSGEVVITIHPIEPASNSVWSFMEKLDGVQAPGRDLGE